jgi:WD40 repeat protein
MSLSPRFLLSLAAFGALCLSPHSLAAGAEKLGDLREIVDARFNHDASRVVVRPNDGDVGIWEVSTGNPVSGEIGAGSHRYLMSGDAKMVLIGYEEGHCRVFDAITAKAISPVFDFQLTDYSMPGVFSPAGDALLLFGDKEAVVFDLPAGKRVASIPLDAGPNELTPGSAAFPANGAQCFIMDGGGRVTLYDTKHWKPMSKPMTHPAAEMAYDFEFKISEDGKWLVTFDGPGENGPKGQLQLWDAVARKPLGKPLSAMNGLVPHFVGANRIAIIPCRGADAHLRELPSMKVAYSFRSHDDLDGLSLDVSPDGKWILTWGEDKRLDLFDAATGKLASNHNGSATISKVMMAPDSSSCFVLFSNSAFSDQNHFDEYVIKLSFPELRVTESLRILDGVTNAWLSPDGKRIMVLQGVSEQERLLFFDAATLKPLQ